MVSCCPGEHGAKCVCFGWVGSPKARKLVCQQPTRTTAPGLPDTSPLSLHQQCTTTVSPFLSPALAPSYLTRSGPRSPCSEASGPLQSLACTLQSSLLCCAFSITGPLFPTVGFSCSIAGRVCADRTALPPPSH